MQPSTPYIPSLEVAVRVKGATFCWASPEPPVDSVLPVAKAKSDEKTKHGIAKPVEKGTSQDKLANPFTVQNLSMDIPRGRLVGIVGPVGSGKSSILQGVSEIPEANDRPLSHNPQLIGEMNIAAGSVEFGGRLAYCQQNGK